MDSFSSVSTSTGSSSSSLSRKSPFEPSVSVVDGEDGVMSESEVEEDDADWKGEVSEDSSSCKDSLSFGASNSQPLQ